MTTYERGDRVTYEGRPGGISGTVFKYVPAQGTYMAICVCDWDDGTRAVVGAKDLERERS